MFKTFMKSFFLNIPFSNLAVHLFSPFAIIRIPVKKLGQDFFFPLMKRNSVIYFSGRIDELFFCSEAWKFCS